MAEHLYLRPIDSSVQWLLLDDASGVVRLRGEEDWAEFESLIRDMSWSGETRVMIPGERVLLTQATVPSRQMRQVMQAVPYMVEERLATDVEQTHFAIGRRSAAGAVKVAAVDRAWFRGCLERLEAAGIEPDSVTVDVQHLPAGTETSVLVDGDRVLVRPATNGGLSIDLALLPTTIALLTEEDRAQVAIYVHPTAAQRLEMYTTQIEAQGAGTIALEEIDYPPFEYLCRRFDPAAIDLLQGTFQRAPGRAERSSRWRNVAVLAACAFGLHIMLLLVRALYLDVKAQQYENEARALYRDVFPAETNVRDVRRRWQARLVGGSAETGSNFFLLFSTAARNLSGTRLQLENVNYNENRGDLTLQLIADSSDPFVRYVQALNEAGLMAEVGAISTDADGARGSIRIMVN